MDLWNTQSERVRQKQEDRPCLLAGSREREEEDTRVEKEGKERIRFAEGKLKDRWIQEDEIWRDRERQSGEGMESEKAFKCCLEIRGTNGSAKILDELTGEQPGAQTHKNECTQVCCSG